MSLAAATAVAVAAIVAAMGATAAAAAAAVAAAGVCFSWVGEVMGPFGWLVFAVVQ